MRQDISDGDYLYQETGDIYISKMENFKIINGRLYGKISLFLLTDNKSVDIKAQAIYRK